MSLNAFVAHAVRFMLGWCWGRCRTFLEYGRLRPDHGKGSIVGTRCAR